MQTNEMTYRVRTIAAVIVAVLLSGTISAAEPQGYYSRVVNQQGDGILAALYETIKGHTDVTLHRLPHFRRATRYERGVGYVLDLHVCTRAEQVRQLSAGMRLLQPRTLRAAVVVQRQPDEIGCLPRHPYRRQGQ